MDARLTLHIPSEEELAYRRFLIADEATMAYNMGYGDNGTGTYHHTPEQAKRWYRYWMDGGNYYAYAVRSSDNVPVGEVSIHFPEGYPREKGIGWIGVIIQGDCRHQGYGEEALRLLVHQAFHVLGLRKLLDDIPLERASAIRIFERVGFRRNDTDGVMELDKG